MLKSRKGKITRGMFMGFVLVLMLNMQSFASVALKNIDFITIKEEAIKQKTINTIVQGDKGFLWIGTEDGLFRYNGYELKKYSYDRYDSTTIGSSYIRCMHVDNNGNLWIGTWGGGLNRYDYINDQFHRYKHDNNKKNCIAGDSINDIQEDREGNLWLAVRLKGLDRLNPENNTFYHYSRQENNTNSLSSNDLDELLIDTHNNLWIGCWYGGLNKLNLNESRSYKPDKAHFTKYLLEKEEKNKTYQNVITLYEDMNQTVWIGTHKGLGLGKYNPSQDKIKFVDQFKESKILSIVDNK